MKRILKKVFMPNKILGLILFNFSMGLLIYVFICHLENNPIAYIAYLLSTYALIIFSIWFYKACQFSSNFIKKNSKTYKMYNKNIETITKLTLILSMSINLVYGLFKLFSGIIYKSEWFITFAIYYLLLCIMKASIVFNTKELLQKKKIEYKRLRQIGILLFILDLVLSGMIILIIHQNQTIIYPTYFIYIVAMYDFYLIISALINVFKLHKQNSPMLIASKCINLTVAMISIISLEVAMISEFGSGENGFKIIMLSLSGAGISFINSIMAIYMITKANIFLYKKKSV